MGLGTMFHTLEKLTYEEMYPEFSSLVGKTLLSIDGLEELSEEVIIKTSDGYVYKLYHAQDCCESVQLVDFVNDIEVFEGATIISAEVVTNSEDNPPEYADSFTWSFYKIETDKGGLFMRWLGESNGYYGEEVTFKLISKGETK